MGVSSLARVMSGWTGGLEIDDGTTAYTITPYTRDSVASFIVRVMHELLVRSGITSTTEVDALGQLTMALSATVDYEASGLTGDRTGIGSGTGATTIPGIGAFDGVLFSSSYGIRLADPLIATGRGGAVADGSGGSAGPRVSGTSSLVVWSASMTVPALGYDFDLWHDGRLQGRFCVKGVVRRPLSRTVRSADTIELDLDVEEVA